MSPITSASGLPKAIIIAVVVVGGLTICVIIVAIIAYKCCRIVVRSRQNPPLQRPEMTVVPVNMTAYTLSASSDGGAKSENTADKAQLCDSF